MNELDFLIEPSGISTDPITMFENIAPYIFNGIAVIGIIMICAGIVFLVHNKLKKKKNSLPAMFGVSGAGTCIVATLSYYLTMYKPSDFGSTDGESEISPVLLFIIACSFIVWLLDKKEKIQ